MLIFFPFAEELIFRLPIIFFFKEFSVIAWIFIVLSAILFGWAHIFNFKKELKSSRITMLILGFLVGIISGYLGVKYQSLYASVLFHAACNLFFVIVLCEILYRLINVMPKKVLEKLLSYTAE